MLKVGECAWELVETVSEERGFSTFAPGIYATDYALSLGLDVREWFAWGWALSQGPGKRPRRETWRIPIDKAPERWGPHIEATYDHILGQSPVPTDILALRDMRLYDPWFDGFVERAREAGHRVRLIELRPDDDVKKTAHAR